MIKADIINLVAEDASITKVKAIEAVEIVFDAMKAAMRRGERIELRGFGVFQVKARKKGIGRNPRTGREVRIPPGKTIRFKPGKSGTEMVLSQTGFKDAAAARGHKEGWSSALASFAKVFAAGRSRRR